jgi:hypothetical protein
VQKNTLGRIYCQTILLENLKDLLQVIQVFLQGAPGDEAIVQVCKEKRQVAKQVVH